MKSIQKNQGDGWQWMGSGYCGLTNAEAKKNIKQLRDWAKDDNAAVKYRLVDCVIVPR